MRLFSFILFLLLISSSSHSSDFYSNKTLKIYSNSAVGSFPDLTARVFAKHLETTLEGVTAVIVVNKPGGSGVIAPNYLLEIAPNDGTNIGYFSNILLSKYISTEAQIRFDPQEVTTLFANIRSSAILASSSKIKSIHDLKKQELELNFGLTSNPSAVNIVERLAFNLFNVKTKYISGYKSNSEVLRSVEQGETDIVIHSANQYNNNFYDTWVKSKKLTPLWVPTFQKNIDIPTINQVYYSIFNEEPKGIVWESYKFVESIQGQQLLILSSAPKEAKIALQKALDKMKNSDSFKKDISLTLGTDVIYYFSLDADRYIKSIKPTDQVIQYLNKH
jgi:tripartite-type tricarboxylate transporter receptor subunit TctC